MNNMKKIYLIPTSRMFAFEADEILNGASNVSAGGDNGLEGTGTGGSTGSGGITEGDTRLQNSIWDNWSDD